MGVFKRRKVYYYRVRVPVDVQEQLGKSEVVRTLKTSSRSVADERAAVMASEIERLFFGHRQQRFLDREKIRELLNAHEAQAIRDAREDYETRPPIREHELDRHIENLEYVETDLRRALATRDYSIIRGVVAEFIKNQKLNVLEGSEDYRILAANLARMSINLIQIELNHAHGIVQVEPVTERIAPAAAVGAPTDVLLAGKAEGGAPLSQVIDEFVADASRAWSPKTLQMYESILGLFLNIVGDLPMDTIGFPELRGFKAKLMKLPAHLKKQFPGKSVAQVLAMDVKPMSVRSVNKYLSAISTLFNYATRHGHAQVNPARDLKVRESRVAHRDRPKFSLSSMRGLWGHTGYAPLRLKSPAHFWLPLIAAHSGLRLEEVAQLHRSDLREVDGVWCFDINAKGDKRLKSIQSERIVPVHSRLLELGLLEYHKSLHHKRLWPRLTLSRDGYGASVSKWFGRYKTRCGVPDSQVFHSFRHSFADALKQAGVADVTISELLGHENPSISTSRYGNPLNVKTLQDAVERVQYAVDLSHLIE